MQISDWKRIVYEAVQRDIEFVLERGGEPFLLPGIIDLLEYIQSKEIFMAVDTNGLVPYYYVPKAVGAKYAQTLAANFGCGAFSWRGFHHEDFGEEADEFTEA